MRALIGLAAIAATLMLPGAARAWPDRPVTIISNFGAGSPVDLIARLIAPKLQGAWGQPVVVQNVVGAAGVIGADRVAKAVPDGHTLLVTGDAAMVVRGSMDPKPPYVTQRDLAPISQLSASFLKPKTPAHIGFAYYESSLAVQWLMEAVPMP